jgi:flavin reductase (DIM6/NTAB) family NADH-FMN oxidoreductase RutF
VVPEALVQAVCGEFYASGDFHRIYFGEIVAAYADEDASPRLSAQEAVK